MKRNKGGRPEKEVKKSCRVEVRLTEAELNKLKKLEDETGLTRSFLFIHRVLDNQNFIVTRDVIMELAKVGTELGKVGNNINQLAKHANTVAKNQPLTSDSIGIFNKSIDQHLENQNELYKILRQMYRVMKK
jgi:cation transport regulator ChaC